MPTNPQFAQDRVLTKDEIQNSNDATREEGKYIIAGNVGPGSGDDKSPHASLKVYEPDGKGSFKLVGSNEARIFGASKVANPSVKITNSDGSSLVFDAHYEEAIGFKISAPTPQEKPVDPVQAYQTAQSAAVTNLRTQLASAKGYEGLTFEQAVKKLRDNIANAIDASRSVGGDDPGTSFKTLGEVKAMGADKRTGLAKDQVFSKFTSFGARVIEEGKDEGLGAKYNVTPALAGAVRAVDYDTLNQFLKTAELQQKMGGSEFRIAAPKS